MNCRDGWIIKAPGVQFLLRFSGILFNFYKNVENAGIFGGLSFSPSFLRQLNVIGEYDGSNFNLGGNILFFKHLFVFAMAHDLQYFSGGIAYRVYLLNYYKKRRKKKKDLKANL